MTRPNACTAATIPLREIDIVGKPVAKKLPVRLPPAFHQVERIRLERLTLIRYESPTAVAVPFYVLRNLPTGFGSNGVVFDRPPGSADSS